MPQDTLDASSLCILALGGEVNGQCFRDVVAVRDRTRGDGAIRAQPTHWSAHLGGDRNNQDAGIACNTRSPSPLTSSTWFVRSPAHLR